MDTKFLSTFFLQNLECLKNLLSSHTIFGIPGIVHDIIADLKHSARIITAADHFRNISDCFLHTLNMSDIIQVNNSTDLIGILKLFLRCIIGRKHNIPFLAADCFGHHQLCHGRTVTATAIFLKNFDQKRVRSCLYCKKLFKSFIPCKCFFYCFRILTDSFLIIKVKRSRKLCGNLLELIQSDKWYFLHNNLSSCFLLLVYMCI